MKESVGVTTKLVGHMKTTWLCEKKYEDRTSFVGSEPISQSLIGKESGSILVTALEDLKPGALASERLLECSALRLLIARRVGFIRLILKMHL